MSRRTISLFIGLAVFAILSGPSLLSTLSGTESAPPKAAHSGTQQAAVYSIVKQQPVTLYTEPDDGVAPVVSRINQATKSIDLVMYELQDKDVESALAAAAGRGVSVRVLLNGGFYGNGSSINQPAYTYFQSHDIPVQWTPSYFALTHQKTLIIDGTDALIMTFNLTPKYYATSRDFGVDDTDTADVAAIEQVFTADWKGTKLSQDSTPMGDDLVWSPGSKAVLLAMISSAKTSLLVDNEEIEDSDIVAALHDAAARGVSVQLLMTDDPKWHSADDSITSAGGEVRTYAANASLYIHAKVIIADGTQAFVGSENFSTSSMNQNRELGLFIATPGAVSDLSHVFQKDWLGASIYKTR